MNESVQSLLKDPNERCKIIIERKLPPLLEDTFKKWHGDDSTQRPTPLPLILEMISKVNKMTGEVLVISNVDIFVALQQLRDNSMIHQEFISPDAKLTLLTDTDIEVPAEIGSVIKVDNLNEPAKIDMMGKKFDVVIGNPPYQEKAGDSTFTRSLQDDFYELAMSVGEHILLVTQGNWCGPKASAMKKDLSVRDVVTLKYCQDAFPNVAEGFNICWFHVDTTSNKRGQTIVTNKFGESFKFAIQPDKIVPTSSAQADWEVADNMKFEKGMDILHKCNTKLYDKDIKNAAPGSHKVLYKLGKTGAAPDIREVNLPEVESLRYYHDNMQSWKVGISNVGGAGKVGAVKVVEPGVVFSKAAIAFTFDTEEEARNCADYLKSDFVATLMRVFKVANVHSKATWSNIPMIDFTKPFTNEIIELLKK
jgi:hypothetical protein